MEQSIDVQRWNEQTREKETVRVLVTREEWEGNNPQDTLNKLCVDYGTANIVKLLRRGTRADIADEAARVLRGGRFGKGQMTPDDAEHYLEQDYVPGTDMKAKEREERERDKLAARAARIRKEINSLPESMRDLVLNDVED